MCSPQTQFGQFVFGADWPPIQRSVLEIPWPPSREPKGNSSFLGVVWAPSEKKLLFWDLGRGERTERIRSIGPLRSKIGSLTYSPEQQSRSHLAKLPTTVYPSFKGAFALYAVVLSFLLDWEAESS